MAVKKKPKPPTPAGPTDATTIATTTTVGEKRMAEEEGDGKEGAESPKKAKVEA